MKEQKEYKCLRMENETISENRKNSHSSSSLIMETGLSENLNSNNMSVCQLHDNGNIFCGDCRHVVCSRCETVHKSHELIKLSEVSALFKCRLTSALVQVRNLIRFANIVQKDLRSYVEKLTVNLAEISKEISERAENLPDDAIIFSKMMIDEVKTEHADESNRIANKMKEFDTYVNNAKTVAIKCENVINARDDSYVIRKGQSVLENVVNCEKTLPVCPTEKVLYVLSAVSPPKECEAVSSQDCLGLFRKDRIAWRIEVRRTGSFKPESLSSSRFVTAICPATEENVWVVWQWGPMIHLIDKDGNVKKSVDAGAKVDDICTDCDGNLVISCHEARCIKSLDSNQEVRNTIQLDKVPRGIDCSSKTDVVFCSVQNMHYKNGDVSNVLKANLNGDSASLIPSTDGLVQPWRVAVNVNGDICVSDRNKGELVIYDKEGRIKATYKGPETSTRHPFAPHAISCDSIGQIFVVDYTNHTVHVLDPLGRFRGFLIMDTELEKRAIFMGTSSPFSIAIDDAGDVWVGNKFGYLTVLKFLK